MDPLAVGSGSEVESGLREEEKNGSGQMRDRVPILAKLQSVADPQLVGSEMIWEYKQYFSTTANESAQKRLDQIDFRIKIF